MRPLLPWLLLSTALGLVLCLLPLFDLLGYESSAACGAGLGLLALLRSSRVFAARRPGRADGPGPLRAWLDLLRENLLLLVPPLLLLLLNALRVKNCDLPMGLSFYAVIVPVSVLAGQSIALLCSPLGRAGGAVGLLIVAAQTGAFLWRLAWQPPIAGHTWTIGWFAGSLYDEAIELPTALLWARLGVLLGSLGLVLGMELRWRWRVGRPLPETALAFLLLLAALLGLHRGRAALDIQHDQDSVKAVLGGRLQTEHFIIYFDPSALDERARRRLAEDHEFRFAELRRWFQVDPVAWRGRPIESFVYANRNQQQRLLGSRQTLVARPWTHQMHIRWSEPGDTALAHELAHLFTAPLAGGWLNLPMRHGLIPDMTLIEGTATAADAPPDELSLHQASRAMRELGLAPDLRRLFDPAGFWNQPGPRAYTLAGSFVSWLVQTHGQERFAAAYASADLARAYGRPLDDLVADWEDFVDQAPLRDEERALAEQRYRRGSIFQRACARTMAELGRRAGEAEARGRLPEAIALRERMRDLEPGNVEHRLELARLARVAGDPARAEEIAERLAGNEQLGSLRQAAARELLGDLAWERGEADRAADQYERCLSLPLDEARQRRLLVKRQGARSPPDAGAEARALLVSEGLGGAARLWRALRWSALQPEDPHPRYLAGRQLLQAGEAGAARTQLDMPLPAAVLDDERALLAAQAALFDDAPAAALEAYEALARTTRSSRVRALAEEGADRARFALGQPLPDRKR